MQINNSISSNISDNIYGNDIVSIEDLNKKEIEKEDIIMNEENLNVNPTVVTNPTTEPINNEINTGAPAFGERFFPSLEDQPTNLNMNNVFDNTQPAQEPIAPQVDIPQPVQPMMEMNSSIPEVPQPSQTGDVLAAMNAIKNLALSIQSIGYKATINEENEQDKYRITIELQK